MGVKWTNGEQANWQVANASIVALCLNVNIFFIIPAKAWIFWLTRKTCVIQMFIKM